MFEDLKNHALSRKHIFEKFKDLSAPKRTLNHWIRLLEQNKPLTRKNGTGRPFFQNYSTIERVAHKKR